MVFGGPKFLRIGTGLPFVLFFPGYSLIAALFPGKKDLDGIERVALSFGLSIAVAPLIGLALNYTPWGIRLHPIAISLLAFILLMSYIAITRRKRLPEDERYLVALDIELPRWRELSRVDRILSVALIASIGFAIGALAYVIVTPKVGERFTEFYILGSSGKAEGYPRRLSVGEEGKVIMGIVNHEFAQVDYAVQVRVGGHPQTRIADISLGHEEKLEQMVAFSSDVPSENMKVEFWLDKIGERPQQGVPYGRRDISKDPPPEGPYRSLHLWVDVSESR